MNAIRPIHLGIALLAAVCGAVAVLAVSTVTAPAQAGSAPMAMSMSMSMSPALSEKGVALRLAMRTLWEDHVSWTRQAIDSLASGSPDTKATLARLLRNQSDIGNAIAPYYGKAAGAKVTSLLRTHILIAADVVAAAKSGDNAKLTAAQARWNANADQIAATLSSVNPRNWKLAPLQAEMRVHLALTTREAVTRLQHNWAANVVAYDAVRDNILGMSDMLAAGIVAQFPGRFS